LGFIWYLYIFAQVPYTHDDWDWGISNGIEQLLTASVNSRYVGNLIIVLLTRSVLLKIVFMAVVSTAIPLCFAKLSKTEGYGYAAVVVLTNLLIITQDNQVWAQTYGWISGFANYVVATLFVLVYFLLVERAFEKENHGSKWYCLLGLALVTFAAQLLLENVTVWLLATGVLALLYALVSKRAVREMLAMLAGLVAGGVVMFSSSIYDTLSSTGEAIDGYRKLMVSSNDGIGGVLGAIINQLRYNLGNLYDGQSNTCLVMLILLTALIIARLVIRKNALSGKFKVLAWVALAINVLLIMYFSALKLGLSGLELAVTATIPWLSGSVLMVLVVAELVLLFSESRERVYFYIAYAWLSCLLIFMPLAVTNSVGERLFFLPYIMQLLAISKVAGVLCRQLADLKPKKKYFAAAVLVLLVISAVPMAKKARDYTQIGKIYRAQLEIIQQAKESGAKEIVLPAYSYELEENYLHFPHPQNEERMGYFKTFYNIDQDVEIIFQY
jgi:hypothetical protein